MITKANFLPYKWGRKWVTRNVIARAFFRYASYIFLVSLRLREGYAIGLLLPIFPYNKILPIANPEASVVSIKGWEYSSLCKSQSSHNFTFKISKAVSYFSVQSKRPILLFVCFLIVLLRSKYSRVFLCSEDSSGFEFLKFLVIHFYRSWFRGLAVFENPSINRL